MCRFCKLRARFRNPKGRDKIAKRTRYTNLKTYFYGLVGFKVCSKSCSRSKVHIPASGVAKWCAIPPQEGLQVRVHVDGVSRPRWHISSSSMRLGLELRPPTAEAREESHGSYRGSLQSES